MCCLNTPNGRQPSASKTEIIGMFRSPPPPPLHCCVFLCVFCRPPAYTDLTDACLGVSLNTSIALVPPAVSCETQRRGWQGGLGAGLDHVAPCCVWTEICVCVFMFAWWCLRMTTPTACRDINEWKRGPAKTECRISCFQTVKGTEIFTGCSATRLHPRPPLH